ncbi:restriction endonuclease subunit S [Nitrosomonas sp. HPC101]|uniref:restriction endonuclease subunit S n=1 Tax=Nitrosomonas sp. HPC101 TaxID=1658667 RepID=UPI00136C969F|nr:restriction endonuclease subunit S [Nitrosomonas sp. HPC101]MXS86139.1 restriction endonuclease subunit S [Nitrosomonas sp. HPC101]
MAFDISSFGIAESSLPSGWKIDHISSLADINPEQVGRTYPHSTIAYLDIGNVASGSIGPPETMPIHNAPSRAKRLVRSADIIISTVRPGNRAYALMREIPDNLVVSTGFAVLRAKNSVNPRFLYHLVTSKPLIEYWASIADEKSAYPSINPSDIAECFVPIPSLLEQNAIAHILGTLDEKIDLNRRINQTLEAMAQAIFKSWFVDFDPVKAKITAIEQGQDPLRAAMRAISGKTDAELDQMPREHHDQLAATAALFPDAMEESELGEIPKGWGFRQIAQFGEVVCGKTPAKSNPDYFGPGTPFIKIPDMHNNVYVTQPSEQLTVQGVASQPKKTIPPGSICVSCIATVGKVVLVHEPSQTNQQINSIIPKRPEYSFYLYFQMLEKQQEFVDLASGGSATLNMNTSTFSKIETLLPGDGIIKKFSESVASVFSEILANQKQADNLAALRDALLPKLLSGELSIPDAAVEGDK